MTTAYSYMHDMGGGWWVLMVVGSVVVWGLVIWAIVTLVGDRRTTRHDRAPVDVLDRRLAAGEISVEEYERLRNAMRPPAPPTRTHP